MVKSSFNRLAFTLIELLFAIMIMGITLVSVPVIMSSNTKGFNATIIQEAIFAASAELNQVLSYRWDENSIDESFDPDALGLSYVVQIADCNNTTRLRPGHIEQPLHRRCIDDNVTLPSLTLGPDTGDLDDIDDIVQAKKQMFIGDATTASGYKHAYQSEFNISYADIGDINSSTKNAKLIEIIVKNDADENVTVLRSYTLNIGEIDFYKRTY